VPAELFVDDIVRIAGAPALFVSIGVTSDR
jgi:hypothetical protein